MLTNATFKIVSWDEEPFDESEHGPKLTRAQVKRVPSTETWPGRAT